VVLKTRHEIRPFVSHLSRQTVPNAGDESKALYLLRYLFSTLEVRCTFNAVDTTIYGWSDSAFAIHEDGLSSTAVMLSVGRQSAPFLCHAKEQPSVAPDIVAGEYYAVNALCLHVSHFRMLSTDLGWPQGPTTIFMDSQSGINLALAPVITKKARHMKAEFHLIREYVTRQEIVLTHTPSSSMRVDVLTKILSKSKFILGRDTLLNM
jgi:hypothetical protein